MKIIKQDLKTGLLIAQAENLDDLWYLSQVIGEGDLVKAKTSRLVKAKGDKVRSDKGQKQVMVLSVRVEKVEFDKNANRLRILGKIEAGPEDLISLGSHHTLEIDEHGSLDMFKDKWATHEIGYLKDAEKSTKKSKVIICIVGDGEATVALVRDRGLHYIDTKENLGGKYIKGREDKKTEFYTKLITLLKDEAQRDGIKTIIVGGPGFEKRNFAEYSKGKLNLQVVDTGNEGKSGVHEIMKSPALEKVIGETRSARESKLMERFLEEISKEGLATYGPKEVAEAVDLGAVQILLVLDKKLRDERDRTSLLIDKTKQAGSEFHILNSEDEPGQKLDGFGGVAAILRYKI